MSLQLPDVVETYFAINNGGDLSRLSTCFCADATVRDENNLHQGVDAIVAWQQQALRAFTFQVHPLQSLHDEGKLTVIARLAGNFPGSPVQLSHVFMLEGNKIRSLEITPC